MKTLILLLGILILQGKYDRAAGQNSTDANTTFTAETTATAATAASASTTSTAKITTTPSTAENETTEEPGSGGGIVTTPDPCTDTPCDEYENCVNKADGKFECECKEGYISSTEGKCEAGCSASGEYSVSNTVVKQDIQCTNGSYNATAGDISVTFSSAKAGDVSWSSETCNEKCNGDDNKAMGYSECQLGGDGTLSWSDPRWTDCSFENYTLVDIVIATDPQTMDDSDVENAIQVIETVTTTGSPITSEEADDILTITNNLLLAETADAKASVQSNSKSILDSIDSVASNVDLPDDTDTYEEEKSNVALAVVKQPPTLRAEQTYYYGPAGEWDQDYNLAASSLTLKEYTAAEDAPSSSYIAGTPAGEGQISFKLYVSTSDLFGKLENQISDKLVLSASGTVMNGYTFRFRINSNISLDSESAGRFNISENGNLRTFKKLQCVRWDRETESGQWDVESQSCHASTAANFFATCKCTAAGEYAVRTIDAEELIEAIEDGLSAGAIAGIVIGSVVGAALIGGGIYYFCFYKKKKKPTAVTPTNDVELRGNDNVVTDDED